MSTRARELLEEQMGDSENPTVPGAGATYGLAVPTGVVPRRGQVQIPPDAIVKRADGSFTYKRFVLTATGLEIPQDVTRDEWAEVGQVIGSLNTSISWLAGDWFAAGEFVWGETYEQVALELGYEVETLYSYASVCRAVKTLIRNQGIFFGHGRVIAKCPDELQLRWAQYTATRGLRVNDLKQEMKLVDSLPDERQIEWLDWVLSQPATTLLSQQDELRPPALLPPSHLPREVLEARKDVARYMKRMDSFAQGNLNLTARQVQQESGAIIAWLERLMSAGGE